MNLLQATSRVPKYDDDSMASLTEHVEASLKRTFYDKLDKHLAETPGGCIIGAPKVTSKVEDDWLGTGESVVFHISAVVEDLPEPPEYRLIGGPADGRIVRTAGQRTWLVPVAPPPPSIVSYVDPPERVPRLVAEYERQGDTAAYLYRRTTGGEVVRSGVAQETGRTAP